MADGDGSGNDQGDKTITIKESDYVGLVNKGDTLGRKVDEAASKVAELEAQATQERTKREELEKSIEAIGGTDALQDFNNLKDGLLKEKEATAEKLSTLELQNKKLQVANEFGIDVKEFEECKTGEELYRKAAEQNKKAKPSQYDLAGGGGTSTEPLTPLQRISEGIKKQSSN